jgi:hypothetical protein
MGGCDQHTGDTRERAYATNAKFNTTDTPSVDRGPLQEKTHRGGYALRNICLWHDENSNGLLYITTDNTDADKPDVSASLLR